MEKIPNGWIDGDIKIADTKKVENISPLVDEEVSEESKETQENVQETEVGEKKEGENVVREGENLETKIKSPEESSENVLSPENIAAREAEDDNRAAQIRLELSINTGKQNGNSIEAKQASSTERKYAICEACKGSGIRWFIFNCRVCRGTGRIVTGERTAQSGSVKHES